MKYRNVQNKIFSLYKRLGLRVVLSATLIVACIWVFAEIAGEVNEGSIQQFDEWALQALRQPNDSTSPAGPGWLLDVMRDITALGGYTNLALVTLFTAGFLLNTEKGRLGLLVLLSGFSGAALNSGLKVFFARNRPEIEHLVDVASASFPSGHAMLSAIVYSTLAAVVSETLPRPRAKFYVIGSAFLLVLLIGFSRVYLGVHYPSDVLGGWAIGMAWSAMWLLLGQGGERS